MKTWMMFPAMVVMASQMLFPGGIKADETGKNDVCKTIVIAGKDIAGKYDISWAEGKMDLTEVDLSKGTVAIEITSSFAGSKVYIDPKMPIIITGSSFLGNCRMPDGTEAVCGQPGSQMGYKSANYDEKKPHIELNISVSFGEVVVGFK
jgi:hypothetical protein